MRNFTNHWLQKAKVTDDPAGDLIADMKTELRRGVNIPYLFHSRSEMEEYVHCRGGCQEAVEAIKGAWIRYRRFVDQNLRAR